MMMNELGIKEFYGYSVMKTAIGNFLKFNNIPITPYLINTYVDDDFSKFVPKTDAKILEKFSLDIENKLFLELEDFYSLFIKKC